MTVLRQNCFVGLPFHETALNATTVSFNVFKYIDAHGTNDLYASGRLIEKNHNNQSNEERLSWIYRLSIISFERSALS